MRVDAEVLLAEWRETYAEPTAGWDFSTFAGSVETDDPPWSYEDLAREALAGATSALDIGTGGGEVLLRLRDALPADTLATEGWAPNLPHATEALAPHGIHVVPYDSEHDDLMPFEDGRFDVVLARHESYVATEVFRVLRPGGVFAGLWNDADLDVPWTVRLVEIVDGPDAVVRDRTPPDFGDRFGPVTTGRFRHDLWLTADELVGMVTTRSPYLVGTPEQQRRLIEEMRELLAANPALVGRFAMPHITRVHRAVRG